MSFEIVVGILAKIRDWPLGRHFEFTGFKSTSTEIWRWSRGRDSYYQEQSHRCVVFELCQDALLILKGSTRQLAFVQFPGIPEAKAFLERHYPAIYMSGSSKNDTAEVQVRIAFSREKVERPPPGKTEGDWKCTSVR